VKILHLHVVAKTIWALVDLCSFLTLDQGLWPWALLGLSCQTLIIRKYSGVIPCDCESCSHAPSLWDRFPWKAI